jgi:hypothetical protein
MAVSTLVWHRFLSRSLHTLHETHIDTYTASWGRCNHTATSPPLSFSDLRRGTSASRSPLSPRTSRRRDQRAGARNARPPHSQACHLQRSGKRVRKARRRAPPAAPRHRISTRLSHRGGAAGHGQRSHAGSKSGCGPRAPAGAGLGRSTVAPRYSREREAQR